MKTETLELVDHRGILFPPSNIFSPTARVTRLLLLAGADPGVLTQHTNNSSLLGVYCSLGYTDMVTLLIGEAGAVRGEGGRGRVVRLVCCDVVDGC